MSTERGQRYAASMVDPGITVDPNWTPDAERETQADRVLTLAVSVMHMTTMKRRLGKDATPQELKADIQTSKRVMSRLKTAAANWGVQPADIEEAYATEIEAHTNGHTRAAIVAGAQRDWATFWADHKIFLQNEVRRVATHALELADRKTANKLVHRLELEFNMLQDVLDATA